MYFCLSSLETFRKQMLQELGSIVGQLRRQQVLETADRELPMPEEGDITYPIEDVDNLLQVEGMLRDDATRKRQMVISEV